MHGSIKVLTDCFVLCLRTSLPTFRFFIGRSSAPPTLASEPFHVRDCSAERSIWTLHFSQSLPCAAPSSAALVLGSSGPRMLQSSATVLALTYYSGAQILLWRSAIALALSNYSGAQLLCCRSAVSVLGRVALVLFGARLLSLSALSGANPMALSFSSVPRVLACVCLC